MTAEGHKVASLHGAKDAAERDAIIDHFREGRDKVSHFIVSFQAAGTKKNCRFSSPPTSSQGVLTFSK